MKKTCKVLMLASSVLVAFTIQTKAQTGTLNYVSKWTPNSSTLGNSSIFDNGTSIGIGTTTPGYRLDVYDGDIRTKNNLYIRAVGTGNGINADDGTGTTIFSLKRQASNEIRLQAYGFLTFYTNGSTGTERMRIDGSGNVGVGTTTPDIAGLGSAYRTLSLLGPNTSAYSCGIIELATKSTDADANLAGVVNFTANANASTKKSIAQIVAWTQGTTATNRGGAISFTTKPDGSTATIERMRITSAGNVGIGTDLFNNPNNYKLAVNGTIGAKAVKVETSSTTWPDFVFNKEYKLKSLKEVEQFVQENGHLPEIPAAKEIEASGADLGELIKLQMQKIEELTLYIIEQEKRIEKLESK